jgi:hypothetical protein
MSVLARMAWVLESDTMTAIGGITMHANVMMSLFGATGIAE